MPSMAWPGCYRTWAMSKVQSLAFDQAGSVSSVRSLIMLPRELLPHTRRVYERAYREQAQAWAAYEAEYQVTRAGRRGAGGARHTDPNQCLRKALKMSRAGAVRCVMLPRDCS